MGVNFFFAAATRCDRNIKPIINFVQKLDWEALRLAYGDYWYNIQNRLHVKDDCLRIDDRIIIPQQLRQTVLDSLNLTQAGAAAMFDLSENTWFPHIHRTTVQMAQFCRQCIEQGNILKPAIKKSQSFQMRPVVEPDKEVYLDFSGPLPDEKQRRIHFSRERQMVKLNYRTNCFEYNGGHSNKIYETLSQTMGCPETLVVTRHKRLEPKSSNFLHYHQH